MKIAILQPVYLPGLGYFEQMARVDRFVYLDDVQYTRRDWRNRNRVKTTSGPVWLTVPVKKHSREALITDIEINYAENWTRRHLRTIEVNYAKCPYFEPLFTRLREALEQRPRLLLDLDCELIEILRQFLAIETPLSFASEVPRTKVPDPDPEIAKNERIIDICKHFDATLLYDGAKAADFIDTGLFERHGVQVVFQDYRHPRYPQPFGEFLPGQSSIDLIMNVGPDSPQLLLSSPVVDAVAGRVSASRDTSAP